jgi:hypothetical protein
MGRGRCISRQNLVTNDINSCSCPMGGRLPFDRARGRDCKLPEGHQDQKGLTRLDYEFCPWDHERMARVAMESLKFHMGPSCPTLLHPAGGPPLKRPFSTPLDTPRLTPILS